jgi:hypothetical protein
MEGHHVIRSVKGLHKFKASARTANLKSWDVVGADWLVGWRGGQQLQMTTDNEALGHKVPQTMQPQLWPVTRCRIIYWMADKAR